MSDQFPPPIPSPAYSVISCKGQNYAGTPSTLTPGIGLTTRWRFLAPANCYNPRILFGNFRTSGVGGQPGQNYISIKATIEPMTVGAPATQTNSRLSLTFGGQRWGNVDPAGVTLSDPAPISLIAGAFYFIRTCVAAGMNGQPPAAAPAAAPTLSTSTTGGSLPASTTYYVVISYVGSYGETIASANTSQATGAGSTNSITVTAPGVIAGSTGYKTYIGTSSSGPFYLAFPNSTMPLTSNTVISLVPQTTYPTSFSSHIAPGGGALKGGTNFYGTNTGEGVANGDLTDDTSGTINAAVSTSYSPMAAVAIIIGKVNPSAALVGDSIMGGTGDAGYGPNTGGFAYRACEAANMGFIFVPQGGEQAHQFANPQTSKIRIAGTEHCTSAICNYGTNDLSLGLASMQVDLLLITIMFTGRKQKFAQCTLIPKTTSSDGWRTVGNQNNGSPGTIGSGEWVRQNYNTWIRSTATTGTTITTETCPFGAANGSNKVFSPSRAFVAGSESVTVNGVAKVLTTDYTYTLTVTIGGVTYASGITFVTAPANATTVAVTYTTMPGFIAAANSAYVTNIFDTAATIEVDATNTLTLNGGYWKAANGTQYDTGTSSGSNTSTTFNDTTKSWTTNQHKGRVCYISGGTGGPSSSSQARTIAWNTATQLNFFDSWSPTPDGTSTYIIYDGATQDGTHPVTASHILMQSAIDVTKLS